MDTSDEKNGNLKLDDFVSKIVTDPANPVGHTVLRGFIGASTDKDHVRVYADESLNSFIDIPQRAIVYTKELSNSPLGGSTIWVKAGTEYVFGQASSGRKARKKFFEGPVYQEYITAYVNQGGPDPTDSFSVVCTGEGCPSMPYCPSSTCPTYTCPTGDQNETIYYQRANFQQANMRRANNFRRIADEESVSFQYCISSACSDICSGSCVTFQYCHTNLCPTGDQYETIYYRQANSFQRVAADDESISFQYCMTTSCTTNCSGSCITFQYCITDSCPPGGDVETNWYQRANTPYQNRLARAGAARSPMAGKGGFNPYRGY